MPTLMQLRDRVRSLKNTQQITRAMKMVAGARIRRAELAMRAARPYAGGIGAMLAELSAAGGATHPLLQSPAATSTGILLMTADKGLCGAFNSNLVRAGSALARTVTKAQFFVVGVKGRVQVRRTPFPVVADWPLQSKPFVELAKDIATQVSGEFLSGNVSAVMLVSSRFVSTIVQRPTPMQLLPIAPTPAPAGAGESASSSDQASARGGGLKNSFEFEPDVGGVLAALLPKYLEFTIFQALLETQASEFAARLIAMTNATDNAGKLIDELTLVMNKTRQASITKEILEIVGGAEALKG
ncbi:MAG: ATP synthase F1 subunit gamma [Candidatus Eremiobacter antarcticus]|nr:ATP synthase F1 subunit gamma [Candidatus Eremiobacteraeota bacterium]MBC5808254.1 ATP synthase F1 subunit gamma [Candidatus Eremiobacteraeota bacterium]PZR63637.1 MAG: ATP synthase F1 subunit gamma [Candidatus Eremiobacter sp. RRmetagenome_bin22]